MTDPQDPYWQNPYTYDPLGRVPPAPPPPEPQVFTPPPAPPYRPPVNVLATLSMVFAFVFAPVGAILGHAGLAQIRRTGELGRDRARAGLALSYVFVAVAVISLVAWATLRTTPPTQTAAPATTSTSAAPPAAVGPVAPDALAALLPGADALKNLTADQNLEAGQTWDNMGPSSAQGAIDRPECWGSIAPGTPDAYTGDRVAGYHAAEFRDSHSFLKSTQVIQAVVAFHDPAAAQAQLAALLSGWRQCGGSTVTLTPRNGEALPFSLGAPADAGNGISTLDLTPKGLQIRSARALAAKANVIVDLMVSCSGTTDSGQPRLAGVGIATYVLGKLPG